MGEINGINLSHEGMGKRWENNEVKHRRGLAELTTSGPQIELDDERKFLYLRLKKKTQIQIIAPSFIAVFFMANSLNLSQLWFLDLKKVMKHNCLLLLDEDK